MLGFSSLIIASVLVFFNLKPLNRKHRWQFANLRHTRTHGTTCTQFCHSQTCAPQKRSQVPFTTATAEFPKQHGPHPVSLMESSRHGQFFQHLTWQNVEDMGHQSYWSESTGRDLFCHLNGGNSTTFLRRPITNAYEYLITDVNELRPRCDPSSRVGWPGHDDLTCVKRTIINWNGIHWTYTFSN